MNGTAFAMANIIRKVFVTAVLVLSNHTVAQTIALNSTTTGSPVTTPAPTHAPFPTAGNIPLPSEFSDIQKEAIDCWDSHINYTVTSSFLQSEIYSAQVYTSYNFETPLVHTDSYAFPRISCSTNYPGLTTLCDGYPRASDCITHCSTTAYSTSIREVTFTGTHTWINPTWTTELEKLVSPTCKVAPDLGPECSRLGEAYTWRVSQFSAQSTASPDAYISPRAPRCSVSVKPPVSEKLKCSIKADSYEAYYWPTPEASDPGAFCANATVTGTPTVTGQPKTAVVSGLTMTSPYVYHILHNVTIYTVGGYASSIDFGSNSKPIYKESKTVPLMSLSQPSSSILSFSKECHKPSPRGATRCTISNHPDFLIQDLATVNAKAYYGEELATPTKATICQASYKPSIALAFSDVAAQNGFGGECQWTWEHSLRTSVVGPDVISFSGFTRGAYQPITASSGEESQAASTVGPESATGPATAFTTAFSG